LNRSADWFHQAEADWRLAELSAASDHHEWASFASSHQVVVKALKALHLQQAQQVWGHGLADRFRICRMGRAWR
jgi:HEPN domain-containing protein